MYTVKTHVHMQLPPRSALCCWSCVPGPGAVSRCNGGVNFMLDWDKEGVYRLAALQSNPGRQLLARSVMCCVNT